MDKLLKEIFELTAKIDTSYVNRVELIKLIKTKVGFEISETVLLEILNDCKSKSTLEDFKTCVMTKLYDIQKKRLFKKLNSHDAPNRNKP